MTSKQWSEDNTNNGTSLRRAIEKFHHTFHLQSEFFASSGDRQSVGNQCTLMKHFEWVGLTCLEGQNQAPLQPPKAHEKLTEAISSWNQ